MEEERLSVSKALDRFSKKLKRFTEGEEQVRTKTSSALLQEQINEREEMRKKAVLRNYSSYVNPLSKALEEDQKNLMDVMELYDSILKLAEQKSDSSCSLQGVEFASPLCSRECYVQGTQFIYLLCWLMFEKNQRQYLPALKKQKGRPVVMEVIPYEAYPFSSEELEIISAIEESLQQKSI